MAEVKRLPCGCWLAGDEIAVLILGCSDHDTDHPDPCATPKPQPDARQTGT